VREVARSLGVSERHLRRVFRDAVGVSPKSFARLARFHRALDAARRGSSWARVAATTGYCDQAHLIDDFRAIAGATPARLHDRAPRRRRVTSDRVHGRSGVVDMTA
jgi:AraC-like DNA-binding protein